MKHSFYNKILVNVSKQETHMITHFPDFDNLSEGGVGKMFSSTSGWME